VSVGHIARTLEDAGIITIAIYIAAFSHVAQEMKLPRVLVTRHPMGRPLGAPGDAERQLSVLRAAFMLHAASRRTVTEYPEPYRIPRPGET